MRKDQNINIVAYAEDIVYPLNRQKINLIANAGWTSLVFSFFHLNNEGDIYYNDSLIIDSGKYKGSSSWPDDIAKLKRQGSITRISASLGGWEVGDFQTISSLYYRNNRTFEGTKLQQNFIRFRKLLPAIDAIDMDCENTYDLDSFIAFCRMLIEVGFKITFCPYTNLDFWIDSLAAIEKIHPNSVLSCNFQYYAGGYGNSHSDWAQAIIQHVPGFNTDNFIITGDWTNDPPDEVSSRFSKLKSMSYVGGGFIWNLDAIYPEKMDNYISAIKNAFR